MQPVRVIAGLGNPGKAYDGTRHNIGFLLLDSLARLNQVKWKEESRYNAHTATIEMEGRPILLLKPQTYMNNSGESIQAICRYLKINPMQVVVAYDEFQLGIGRLKVNLSGSAGGHNGVEDIINRLGERFVRYRIGIGPAEKPNLCMSDFVLGNFSQSEKQEVEDQIPYLIDGLRLIVRTGAQLAMNQLNQR